MRESRNDRTRHEDLGQRIEPASTWADILVGEQQRERAASAAHILPETMTSLHREKFRRDGVTAAFWDPPPPRETTPTFAMGVMV
jgi:hypothetical protein